MHGCLGVDTSTAAAHVVTLIANVKEGALLLEKKRPVNIVVLLLLDTDTTTAAGCRRSRSREELNTMLHSCC